MLEFQRLLLADTLRNDAFVKALKSVITPGKTTVADIGSGTGFLSFVAEKLGAKACSLYEISPQFVELSKMLAKENDIKRCTFSLGHSTEVKNPQKVDVVVSETLGNWAYEENIIETMNDARRFLKPNGVMIPQELRCFVAPVTSSRLYDELNAWDNLNEGLNFSKAKEICMNNMYVKEIFPADLPSPARAKRAVGEGAAVAAAGEGEEGLLWDVVDFQTENSSLREKTLEWKMQSNVTLYGYACWWDTTLVNNVTLSTSPFAPMTHWKQIYLPVVDPLPVRTGETVKLNLKSDSRYEVKINVEWETALLDRKGKTLKSVKQDMRKGYLA